MSSATERPPYQPGDANHLVFHHGWMLTVARAFIRAGRDVSEHETEHRKKLIPALRSHSHV